ncbi:MAG: spore coat protein H, partial [Limisphaerales bacterium]
MKGISAVLNVLSILCCLTTHAQPLLPVPGEIYDDSEIPVINILIAEDSLAALYANPWGNYEYKANFVYTVAGQSDTVEDIGLRVRGNFSRGAGKKNFKVSFNTYVDGGKYKGYEKFNLNSQHNDPTISRSKVSFDLYAEMDVISPRSNHVELYFNGAYYGLYLNTEHIDEEFTEAHLGSDLGNLYKCTWPADLTWSGSSPSSYESCDQTQEGDLPGYTKLIEFIDILNNSSDADFPCEIESIFDVQSWLQIAAVEVLIAHWDAYIFNKNNFYLYEDPVSGKVNYIPFDVDNTHGIAWSGTDWKIEDIYSWNSSQPRPLYERFMDNVVYRDYYSYYINKMLTTVFDPISY